MSRFSDFGNALYSGDRSIDFVGRRKIWYAIAALMVAFSIIISLPSVKGFTLGIEFVGGSEFRISGVADQKESLAKDAVASVDSDLVAHVAKVGADSIRVQTEAVEDVQAEGIRQALAKAYGIESSSVTSSFIGANWGADVTSKAINGLLVFLALAAVLMALYFRTLKMSVAAIVALLHDLIITAGIYAAVGFEVTPAAVIGFLTILGYSLYDTVVVFDKIRENTHEVEFSETKTFAQQVNYAINQTLVRSINTSVVAVLPVAAILFIGANLLGAGTLRDIALALFIGMILGTYSTIFIAAPLYSHMREGEPKFRKAAEKVAANA
jgi:preprotein translocase subunit SecF